MYKTYLYMLFTSYQTYDFLSLVNFRPLITSSSLQTRPPQICICGMIQSQNSIKNFKINERNLFQRTSNAFDVCWWKTQTLCEHVELSEKKQSTPRARHNIISCRGLMVKSATGRFTSSSLNLAKFIPLTH